MLVRIEATTQQLRQELSRSESSVASTAQNIDRSLATVDGAFDRLNANARTVGYAVTSVFDKIGAGNLAAAGSVAGLVALTTSTIDYAREVKNLAQLSNTSVEDFQRLAFGAKSVGVEQDKLSDILKDTNDRVGEFLQRGSGEMADFFKEIAPQIGVTAGQFANLSGPQALQLYYTSLEKAGLNQQQVTTYMEAMADEATALIPLLRNNGKGFQELGDQAERAGSVISDFNISRLVAAGQAISELKASFTGVTNQIVVGLLPGIESVTEGMKNLRDNGGAQRLGETISFLAENVDVLVAALGGKLAASFAKFAIDAVASAGAATKAMLANVAATKTSAIAKAEETAAATTATAAKLKESVASFSAAQALETETAARLASLQVAQQQVAYQARLAVGTAEEARYAAALAAIERDLAAAKAAAATASNQLAAATAATSAAMARDTAATTANAAAQAEAAAAKNVLARAGASLLGLLGGPAGIAALAIGVGVAFLTMGTNAQSAKVDINDLKRSVEEVRKEFKDLTRDQQQSSLVTTLRQQEQAASDANDAYSGFLKVVRQELGSTVGIRIASEFDQARKSGNGLSGTLDDIQKRFHVPEEGMRNLRTAAGSVSTLDQQYGQLTDRVALFRKELDGGTKTTKGKTDADIAADNAAKNYQQTLDKQLNTLRDKTKLEEADRFITDNKIDPQGELAKQIRETAKAYDAQKQADKDATEATQKSKEAQSKLEQQLKASADSYAKLKEQFDPVGAASDEQAKKTDELRLLYQKGKISTEEYGQGIQWLQKQYDGAVASANGMAEALKYEADLQRQLANAQASYDQMAASVGMGSKESERSQARLSLERETNDKVLALRTELATATTDKQRKELENQIALTQKYGPLQVDALVQGYQKLDEAQSNWSLGARAAFEDFADSGKDVAGQTKAAFTSLFDGLTDAAVDWAFGADKSFGDVLISFGKMIAKMELQAAASSVYSGATGAGGLLSAIGSGIANVFSGGPSSAGSTQAGYTGAAYQNWASRQADGGAWQNGVQMFANGAAFTNSIVDTPTAFGMAGGDTGIMGEAGPEAIMPLARAPDGSLGVRMVGGGGTAVAPDSGSERPQVNIYISSDGKADVSANQAGLEQFGNAMSTMAQVAQAEYRKLETKSLGPMGNIRQAINGRR